MTDERWQKSTDELIARRFKWMDDYRERLMGDTKSLEKLSIRRLLRRAGSLLQDYYSYEEARNRPDIGICSKQLMEQYAVQCRIRQVELAIGRGLAGRLETGLGRDGQDELCAAIGFNLVGEFFDAFFRKKHHEFCLMEAGEWAALYEAGKLSDEDFCYLSELYADGYSWGMEGKAPDDEEDVDQKHAFGSHPEESADAEVLPF